METSSKFIGSFLLALLGLLAGIAVGVYLPHNQYLPSELARKMPGSWHERAIATTMKNRRTFTLPLNNPDAVRAARATHMQADDLVVGIRLNGRARAYPWWIIANYHVVNDTLGHIPVYVGLCELCSGASAFSPEIPELPGRPLVFQISGRAAGTFRISDVQTQSTWHPFSGLALKGPLRGKALRKIPSVMTRWSQWLEMYPDSDVLFASESMRLREHAIDHQEIGAPDRLSYGIVDDTRLLSNTLVYGVVGTADGSGLAIELEGLRTLGVLQAEFDGQPLLVFIEGDYRVYAYSRSLHGTVLDFEQQQTNPALFRDQLGNLWNHWGLALEGPDAGAQLEPVRGYLTEWYEWVSGAPETAIYPILKD